MTISDETLMAYLDNELPLEERARVDDAMAGDPDLRLRMKQQERVHSMLAGAFGPMIDQRVPDRLVRAAMTTPASVRWRAREGLGRLFFANRDGAQWIPAAALSTAALALGVGLGWFAAGVSSPDVGGVAVMAQGPLAAVLEQRLASDEATIGPRVGVSFRAKDGALCRTFDMGAAQANAAGIACRSGEGWAIGTLAHAEPRANAPYETVGAAMPTAVRDALNTMIAGEALDAEQERRARDDGWRAVP